MWPRDQRAAVLAKYPYFSPQPCVGPVGCNISIHMCTNPPECVCACQRRKETLPRNKSSSACLNCSIKTIFVCDPEEERRSRLTACQSETERVLLFWFDFPLNSVSHYCAQPQAVRTRTRATVPEPRGPQEPWGVPTLMEAWASLEQIAWWGQKRSATTALLLQTPTPSQKPARLNTPILQSFPLWCLKIPNKYKKTLAYGRKIANMA